MTRHQVVQSMQYRLKNDPLIVVIEGSCPECLSQEAGSIINDQGQTEVLLFFTLIGDSNTPNEQAYRNFFSFFLDNAKNTKKSSVLQKQIALLSHDQTLWIKAIQSFENKQTNLLYERLQEIDSLAQKYGPKSNIVLHAYLRKAIILYLTKDFQRSYQFFHKGIPALGWNSYPYLVFAKACFDLDKYEQSVKWLQISLKKACLRNYYKYRVLLAMNFVMLGEFQQAEKIIRYHTQSDYGQMESPIRKVNQVQILGKLNLRHYAIQLAQQILAQHPGIFMIHFVHIKILLMINYEIIRDQGRAIENYCQIYDRISKQQITFKTSYLSYLTKQLKVLVEYGFKYNQLRKGKWFLELLYTRSIMTNKNRKLFPKLIINQLWDLEQQRHIDYESIYIHY